jgi:hypothetical protein
MSMGIQQVRVQLLLAVIVRRKAKVPELEPALTLTDWLLADPLIEAVVVPETELVTAQA